MSYGQVTTSGDLWVAVCAINHCSLQIYASEAAQTAGRATRIFEQMGIPGEILEVERFNRREAREFIYPELVLNRRGCPHTGPIDPRSAA